jgi:hypothetical protein
LVVFGHAAGQSGLGLKQGAARDRSYKFQEGVAAAKPISRSQGSKIQAFDDQVLAKGSVTPDRVGGGHSQKVFLAHEGYLTAMAPGVSVAGKTKVFNYLSLTNPFFGSAFDAAYADSDYTSR